MTTLAVIAALCACVATTFGQNPQSIETGRIGARYNKNNYQGGATGKEQLSRDNGQQEGNLQRGAVWTGRAGEQDDAWNRNQQQFRDQAGARRQQYGNNNKNFGNIVNQIRDEGLRNAYNINDASKYNRNDQTQASGFNAANARKNAFDRGNDLQDNINYSFNKKFNKQSSENGGFEDENGRAFSKVDLIDEREKDQAIKRNDNAITRRQNDKQQAIKESDWKANAKQAKANAGQYGFGDRRLEAAGERSDDRAIDYNRKDDQFRENESGVDSATRLAKDLAEQAAGYRNEAGANADSARTVKDGKYYAGSENDPNNVGAVHGGTAGNGDKTRKEGSGGNINTGFNENADQKENGEEVARATALSSADAKNEYSRLKDRVAYAEVKGLKDRAQGAFKQGLLDSTNQGFSNNAAEAAKDASESDRNFAGSASASDFAAKQNSVNEALRDRDYYLKKANDENETFTRRKQFFHNKNEGGSNDENLKYDRNKKAREFGAAEEADLAKQNQFAKAQQENKNTNAQRSFEDSSDKRAQLQHQKEDRVQTADGFANHGEEEAAKAGARIEAQDRRHNWQTADDSRSDQTGTNQGLWEKAIGRTESTKVADQHQNDIQADVEQVEVGGEGPFGNINSRQIIGKDILAVQENKKKKEYHIPDLVVEIEPASHPVRIAPPKKHIEIAPLPAVQPVKTYKPPKYNKKKVDYSSKYQPSRSRYRAPAPQYHGFQRINNSLFAQRDQDRFRGISNIGRGKATSSFRKPNLSFGKRRTSANLGSLNRGLFH